MIQKRSIFRPLFLCIVTLFSFSLTHDYTLSPQKIAIYRGIAYRKEGKNSLKKGKEEKIKARDIKVLLSETPCSYLFCLAIEKF